MSNKKQTPYDEMKGFLSIMRNLNESRVTNKKVINEDVEIPTPMEDGDDINEPEPESSQEQFDNVEVINDVEVKLLSFDQEDVKLQEDEKDSISQLIDSIRQQVAQLIDLDPGFMIDDKQIRLDGSISDLDVNFVMIVGQESGLYINSDMLPIEDETMTALNKLVKFLPTFTSSMEPLIRTRRAT
jgi:hypothetical protein